MKKTLLLLAVLAGSAAFAQNVAVVNGEAIPSSRADLMYRKIVEREGKAPSAELEATLREKIKGELINRQALAQEAERRGIANSPAFQEEMEIARQAVLVGMLFDDFNKTNKLSDAEIKAGYDRALAEMNKSSAKEYRARHILVEDEALANSLTEQLKKGASFEKLAKKHSKDPGSGAQGGDLGWANPNGYVPEFAAALDGLTKGKMTATPVKTQFGYHIIRLDDAREGKRPTPPPFEQVKVQLGQQLMTEKVTNFQKSIFEKIKVE